jgi:hypothetical protein
MQNMFDASTPPLVAPGGFHAVAGYIGGRTPHVWTLNEWQRFHSLRKLPIYVPSQAIGGHDVAAIDVGEILHQCYHLQIPRGTPIVLDMETAADKPFDLAVADMLHFFGYRTWIYGSRSTIGNNPPCDGEWVAEYTHVPHMVPGGNVKATQWTDAVPGKPYDQSLVRWLAFETLWR